MRESQQEPPLRIGVLALQGAFDIHARRLKEIGAEPVDVRTPDQLGGPEAELDGLILPGGESTTMLKFLERGGFFDRLKEYVRRTPTFGTCAGAILLATEVESPAQRSLGALDITVERNAYGRQIDSTILTAETLLPGGPLEMVFIRAPRISAAGPGVEVLATRDGFPALVRGGEAKHILAATFHPELSTDQRVHRLFLEMARENKASASLAKTSARPMRRVPTYSPGARFARRAGTSRSTLISTSGGSHGTR